MIFGLMIGLFAGLGLALLFESLDNTVKDADDVKKYSGIPLLGMVPAFSKNGRKRREGEAFGESSEAEEKGRPNWLDALERIGTAVGLKKI